jgi:ribosome biogenesis protein Tsr3
MPVMVLEVPLPAWNQVVIQSVLFGLDMSPDKHSESGKPTVVEVTGSWEKLQQAYSKMRKWGPELPHLLAVNGTVPIQDGG